MGGVAVRAIGGDGQPALEQSLAMNTVGVVFDDVALLALIPQGGLRACAVATATELGNVAGEGGRG